jgi:wyosine [tRNA(Phe)-imidazoG37] synthetase (radical SAM superfamily)
MKTVYGPVPSWRLGKSLGIDVISVGKICSFDCVYCQLGAKDEMRVRRAKFVEPRRIQTDLSEALAALTEGDVEVITFSGTGEPTLASNLGEVIEMVRGLTDVPLAILTNSSLLHLKEVRTTLQKIDTVVAKLDAPNVEIFQSINRPHPSLSIDRIITGIKELRKAYEGEFELQMMFIPENKRNAEELASLAVEIDPDRVEINTPLRGCPVKPLSREDLRGITRIFEKKGLDTVSVYEARKPEVKSVNYEETSKRRPE